MVCTSTISWVIADKVVFLASADSNAMTGQCMHLVCSLAHRLRNADDVEQRPMDWIDGSIYVYRKMRSTMIHVAWMFEDKANTVLIVTFHPQLDPTLKDSRLEIQLS